MKIKYRITEPPRLKFIKHLESLGYTTTDKSPFTRVHFDVDGVYQIFMPPDDHVYERIVLSIKSVLNIPGFKGYSDKYLDNHNLEINKDNLSEVIDRFTLEYLKLVK